ncbi:MAG: hypothetical protein TE42_06820 [Candidatus Synechococcus spongiarum SP3]|uniref:Uncharacterized protein n=1 Tax=Candidatus Synechococcus spongiarum SP3 TaxID=1604020 RepID=A0A0G2IW27_9SYNE|nr:MAG: hypothetical protein TE42_06820 [Candidatus Synechococcus spongiarum SP3]
MVLRPGFANPWKVLLRRRCRFFPTETMQQQVKRQQQAGHQAHKPAIAGEFSKAVPVFLSEAIEPEMPEIPL